MNIAIVDDQKEFLSIVGEIVSCLDYDFYSYTSVYELEKTNIYFDLILLDIDMPDCNGIKYAKKHHNMNVIFITNRDDLIKDAFGNNIYGFVSKSDPQERYIKVIEETIQRIQSQRMITLKSGRDIYRFIERNITYLMYIGYKTISIVYRKKSYIIKGYSLKEIKEKLGEKFIFIDKSTIINTEMIISLVKDNVYLDGIEQSFPVSRNKKEILRKYMGEGVD